MSKGKISLSSTGDGEARLERLPGLAARDRAGGLLGSMG
jgi:hypothetical protein